MLIYAACHKLSRRLVENLSAPEDGPSTEIEHPGRFLSVGKLWAGSKWFRVKAIASNNATLYCTYCAVLPYTYHLSPGSGCLRTLNSSQTNCTTFQHIHQTHQKRLRSPPSSKLDPRSDRLKPLKPTKSGRSPEATHSARHAAPRPAPTP